MSPIVKRLGLIIVVALVGLMDANVHAGSAWDLVHPDDFDWSARADRRSVAADLISRISLLAAVVPPQAPDQIARLKADEAELAALGEKATARQRSRLYLSRAYQHRRLVELLGNLLDALACVRSSVTVDREMFCWVEASALLMDEETLDISLNVLRQGRMIPRDEDMPVKAQDPKVWYSEYGRGVVRHIIRPYLESLAVESAKDA